MNDLRIATTVLRRGTLIACALALAACATRQAAPVEDRRPPAARAPAPATAQAAPGPAAPRATEPERAAAYTVKRGDTLAGIALEHGLDYRELAVWNAIENPNRIFVGQVLRLAPPGEPGSPGAGTTDPATGVVTAPLRAAPAVVESRPGAAPAPAPASGATRNTESLKVSPKAVKEPYSEALAREMAKAGEAPPPARAVQPAPPPAAPIASAAASVPPPAPPAPAVAPPSAIAADDESLDWIWPAKGKIVTGFSDNANLKGIDIAGTAGQPVVASAAGRVVYAGTGLRGYGKLVIVKHNDKFLTAYAHNREILVKEGQQVARGQKIAEMGNTDADQVKLHFEIRRLGKPMDPLKYLPPA
ncbi:MAG: peptidoglycan DD-metalloendopeptidase family protein [Betaproteobacteria bacterium]|nr:peptidoglycan DD-metalloendopeptidase family protein [Betaproteobacteria bacterium]